MKIVNLFFVISIFFTFSSLSNETTSWELLKEGGKVVFIRHAYAPGGGDPKNFDLYDCSTQRNLNEEGINQSKIMGKLFSEYSIPIDSVYSSQWCRYARPTRSGRVRPSAPPCSILHSLRPSAPRVPPTSRWPSRGSEEAYSGGSPPSTTGSGGS